MTIRELALCYGDSALLLRGRIRELEALRKQTEEEEEQRRLDNRLRPLRAMYRETRAVERHLLRYCARRAPEQGGGSL